ncbi:MAG: right-handed parallel beta-helix repeat-containing protein, partial [Anaerolineae bacterium]
MEVRIPFDKRQVHGSWRTILPVLASAVVLVLALLALLEVVSDPATADVTAPDVGGTLPGTQYWTPADNPHVVTETVIVPADATLFVSPGVEVYFDQDTGIQVAGDGRLQAEGTAADPILFTANTASPSRGYWDRIFFDDTALASTLSYCLVEYAGTGVAVGGDTDFHTIDNCTFRDNGDDTDWTSGGAIHSAGDELTITNNELYDNELGLRLRKSFGDVISGNVIHDNDGFGIGFLAAAAPGGGNNTITGNEIYGNGGFGLGFVSEGIYEGGNSNQILNNDIHDTVAAGGYGGDGLYLDVGLGNTVSGNSIYGNEGHGVWAMSQELLAFTENIVRGNGLNGLTLSEPGTAMTIHSNVLCNNAGFQLQNQSATNVIAEGNWFGTNTPGATEVDGPVDYTPWITMGLSVAPDQLPADGLSTATLTLTMNDGAGHAVPDGYPVEVTVSEGSLSPTTLTLTGGQATATYTAGTTAGTVDFYATDGCGTITHTAELELQAVDLAIDKTGPGGTTRPGELVTFTIDVSELNGVDARDVVITDDLPAGASWSSDTSASCGLSRQQPTPSTVVWSRGLWLAGESCQFEVTVLVGGDACLEETLVNHVEITSTTTDDDLSNNSATTTIDSPALVCLDLAVAKDDGAGAVLVWQPEKAYVITYTVTYSNEGYVDATGVTLTDTLPEGSQVYAANGWDCPDGTCTYTVGALSMGARQTAPPLVVEVLSCGDLRNEVTIGDDGSL